MAETENFELFEQIFSAPAASAETLISEQWCCVDCHQLVRTHFPDYCPLLQHQSKCRGEREQEGEGEGEGEPCSSSQR